MGPVSRAFRTFSTRDLILIAIVAALGISIKPVVVPLAHLIAAPLFVPAGALAGGLYMMWLVVGMGLVPRRGTATLIALVQALLVMFTGVVGSHGAMSLVSYTAPGIVMDLGLLLIRHRACCLRCCFLAGVLANATGTLAVSFIFFRLPPIPLALALCTAALSGGVGGIIAWEVIKLLRRYRLGVPSDGPAGSGPAGKDKPRARSDALLRVSGGAGGLGRSPAVRQKTGRRLSGVRPFAAAALLAAAVAFAGCSGSDGAPRSGASAAPPAAGAPGGHITFTYGTTDQNGTLVIADVFAGTDAAAAQRPLAEALSATGHTAAERVAIYKADGSIVAATVASCAVTDRGSLVVDGHDAGVPAGIVLDPPSASVRDVRSLAQAALEAGESVLVVLLDGFGYDQYIAAKARGEIPHLARLAARKAATVYPTITPVAFASMVSGQDPATTGVRKRGVHRLACETIYGWVEARGQSTSLVEGDVQILELTDNTVFTVDEDGDGLTDGEVFAAAKRVLTVQKPDFMLIHFHGIDDTAHREGPFGEATRARVREEDAMVGELMRMWSGRIIVVADHGQHTVEHPQDGEGRGSHGDFRSEDLFIPVLVGDAR